MGVAAGGIFWERVGVGAANLHSGLLRGSRQGDSFALGAPERVALAIMLDAEVEIAIADADL